MHCMKVKKYGGREYMHLTNTPRDVKAFPHFDYYKDMNPLWETNEEAYLPDPILNVATFTGPGGSRAVAGVETHASQVQYSYGLDDNQLIYSSIGNAHYLQDISEVYASPSTLQQSVGWHATTDATVVPRPSFIQEMNEIISIDHEVIPEVTVSSFDSRDGPRDSPPVIPKPLLHTHIFDQATLDNPKWNDNPRKHPFVQSGRAYLCMREPCHLSNRPIFKKDKNSHDVAVHHDVPRDVSPEGSRSRKKRCKRKQPTNEHSHNLEPGPSARSSEM